MDVGVPLSLESGSCSNFVHQTRESRGVSMSSPEIGVFAQIVIFLPAPWPRLRFPAPSATRSAGSASSEPSPDFRETPHSKRCAITLSMIPYCFASSAVKK
jgi:hypothetical protein